MSYEHELRSFHKIADSILSVLIIEVPGVEKSIPWTCQNIKYMYNNFRCPTRSKKCSIVLILLLKQILSNNLRLAPINYLCRISEYSLSTKTEG